jgi:putative hydrolase
MNGGIQLNLVEDTHTHTLASGHAYSTIIENAREAGMNGMEAIAMTDHGPAMPGAASLLHFWNLKAIPEHFFPRSLFRIETISHALFVTVD